MEDEKNPMVTMTKTKVTTLVTTIGIIALAAGLAGGVWGGATNRDNAYKARVEKGESHTVKVPLFVAEEITSPDTREQLITTAKNWHKEDYDKDLASNEAVIMLMEKEGKVSKINIAGGSEEEIVEAVTRRVGEKMLTVSPGTGVVTGNNRAYSLWSPNKVEVGLGPSGVADLLVASNMYQVVTVGAQEGGGNGTSYCCGGSYSICLGGGNSAACGRLDLDCQWYCY